MLQPQFPNRFRCGREADRYVLRKGRRKVGPHTEPHTTSGSEDVGATKMPGSLPILIFFERHRLKRSFAATRGRESVKGDCHRKCEKLVLNGPACWLASWKHFQLLSTCSAHTGPVTELLHALFTVARIDHRGLCRCAFGLRWKCGIRACRSDCGRGDHCRV